MDFVLRLTTPVQKLIESIPIKTVAAHSRLPGYRNHLDFISFTVGASGLSVSNVKLADVQSLHGRLVVDRVAEAALDS